jgi:hypothetical protein
MIARACVFAAGLVVANAALATNLVPNPDFDAGLDGWTPIGSGTVTIDPANGQPTPPSVHLVADSTAGIGLESSCIEIDNTVAAYFQMRAAGQQGYVGARIEPFADAACTIALDTIDTEAFHAVSGWSLYGLPDFALPDATRSARVLLIGSAVSLGDMPDVYFDHIEFGPAPSDGIPLDQEGLTGAWYNPATSGQGFEFVFSPYSLPLGVSTLFGAWYTYDVDAGGTETQRWYSLDSHFGGGTRTAAVTIYQNTGGNFAALPQTWSVPVGTGTLSFDTCFSGTFTYVLDDGRSGSVPLQNLLPNVECVEDGTFVGTGSDYGLSGAWFDAATSGQGFMVNVNPVDAEVFVGWYTYAADGETQGVGGQRWFSAQGSYEVGSTSMDLTLYASQGGTLDSGATPVTTDPVGTATISFADCSTALFTYAFTSGELNGRSGSIPLTRLGLPLASCDLP